MVLHYEYDPWVANAEAWLGKLLCKCNEGFANAKANLPVHFANTTSASRMQRTLDAQLNKS